MRKIVLLGATGSVGAYASLHLKDLGIDVIATGHRQTDNGFFAKHGIEYVSLDVRRSEEFAKLPATGVWAIVDLAGAMPARMNGYHPQEYIDTNVTGTLNVLEYARRCGAERVVYAQSISDAIHLYGTTNPIPADIEMKFPLDNDHSVYSITKNSAVALTQHYSARFGFSHFILRFPNIYVYHPNPYYFVDGQQRMQGYRTMIYRAMKGEPIEIWGDPQMLRDMVYVKDCTQIIGCCLTATEPASGFYNVGTGMGTTLEEQVRGIVRVFSPEDRQSPVSYRPEKGSSPQYIMDISKTRRNLGYEPRYGYIDYLADFKREMLQQRFSLLWGEEQQFHKQ